MSIKAGDLRNLCIAYERRAESQGLGVDGAEMLLWVESGPRRVAPGEPIEVWADEGGEKILQATVRRPCWRGVRRGIQVKLLIADVRNAISELGDDVEIPGVRGA
jgi:hypothetical protein